MRASVLFEQGKPLSVEELELGATAHRRGARADGGQRTWPTGSPAPSGAGDAQASVR